jgi:dinuclear metal center YbgI/SA1388 family protein
MDVTAVLVTIDITEEVIQEAIGHNCNLIISHHPLIFSGLKRITGQNLVQRCVALAIKNDIAIYAAHTNLDNVLPGVSGKIASKIGLQNLAILQPKSRGLLKLITFVPQLHAFAVRQAMFDAGAGSIGNYDSCSYNMEGFGTFRANENAKPFVGEVDKLHSESEMRIEVILPAYNKSKVLKALVETHPYEEPAFDIVELANSWETVGAGIVGELEQEEDATAFLNRIKTIFNVPTIRHTQLNKNTVKRVALCGGAGSSFLSDAIAANADVYISGDFKYHEFFDAENRIIIADIGHFESEQFTKDIFYEIITEKMPTFAVRISDTKTNPINYL